MKRLWAVIRRREAGYDWIRCGVCETQVSILDREEHLTPIRESVVQEMDRSADAQRDLSTVASILQGKIATGDFDVFLCHNGKDKPKVKEIGGKLKEEGILPWFDEWELRPGLSWQQQEIEAFLRQFVKRGCPVIPILLPDAPRKPRLPIFLEGLTWVDFRIQEPDLMERLIWGITGERERFG
jgi:hypothetical protein